MEEKTNNLESEQTNSNNNETKDSLSTDDNKNSDDTSTKKKFRNTVFAEKMRQRKLQEKNNKVCHEEMLKTCKQISIEVKRLPVNLFPKFVVNSEQKKRKKKKFSWQLGLIRKKKKNCKSQNPETKKSGNTNSTNSFIKESSQKPIDTNESSATHANQTEINEIKSLGASNNFDSKVNSDNHSDDERSSVCIRTLPFNGKLNTKEARKAFLEKFCKSESLGQKNINFDSINKNIVGQKNQSNSSILNNQEQEPISKKKNQSSKKNMSAEGVKVNENQNKSSDSTKDNDLNKFKSEESNAKNSCSLDNQTISKKDLDNLESKKTPVTADETKEDKKPSCSRILPFNGKPSRKSQPNVPELSVDLDNSSKVSELSNSLSEDGSAKAGSLTKKITNSGFSKSKNTKVDSSTKSLNGTVSDQSNLSSKEANISLNVLEDKSINENTKANKKDVEKIKMNPNTVKIDTCKSTQNLELKVSGSTESKLEVSNVEADDTTLYCQRILPYDGRSYCSRTLPFKSAAEKAKVACDLSKLLNTSEVANISSMDSNDVAVNSGNQSKDTKVPLDQENKNNSLFNSTTTTNSNCKSPMLNGDWKFKRKRQQTESQDDSKLEELITPKKAKGKSPLMKKTSKEKTVSPSSTICSMFDLNCTKHDHHHSSHINRPNVTNYKSIIKCEKNLCIRLTRLEQMSDPLVLHFLNNKSDNLIEKKVEDLALVNGLQDDSNDPSRHKSRSSNSSIESLALFPSSKRRKINRLSSESPETTTLSSKRKKSSVCYMENFSDSEDDNTVFKRSLRSRPQKQETEFQAHKELASSDSDDDDREVQELSRLGQIKDDNVLESEQPPRPKTRSQGLIDVSLNESLPLRQRSKSVLERKTERRTDQQQLTDAKTPCLKQFDEQNKCSENDEFLGKKSMEQLADKTADLMPMCTEANKDKTRITTGRLSFAESCATNDTISDETENNKQSTAVNTRRLSCAGQTVSPLHNQSSKKSQNKHKLSVSECVTVPTVTNETNLDSYHNQADSSIEKVDVVDRVKLKELRVQLIKLETVCGKTPYQEYTASEFEELTHKYINMLMSSNFLSDTWRAPINYHCPSEIQQVGDSTIFDGPEVTYEDKETVNDTTNVCHEIYQQSEEPEVQPIFELPFVSKSSPKKSPGKSSENVSPNKPQDQVIPVVPIIENLITEAETLNNTIVDENAVFPLSANQQQIKRDTVHRNRVECNSDASKKITSKKKPTTLVVNGTPMYVCKLCNKIFVTNDLLKDHKIAEHARTDKKSSSKPVGENRKVHPQAKSRKKLTCSDSLECTICSTVFETKEILFEHIMTHNEHELQEAYKNAKAKARQQGSDISLREDQEKDSLDEDILDKDKQRKSTDNSSVINSNRSSFESDGAFVDESASAVISRRNSRTEPQVIDLENADSMATIEPIHNHQMTAGSIVKICPCHPHESGAEDLQLEMTLLCKTCNMIFRRRECFEVHYRSSPECRRCRTSTGVKVPKLFCSGCPCVLDDLPDMRVHIEMHAKKNSQGTVTFICNICKVVFLGVGGLFYNHWFNHMRTPDYVASMHSFPKLSVVTVCEDTNATVSSSKSQEGFFYIAEHVCRLCKLTFSSDPELQAHNQRPCQPQIQQNPAHQVQEVSHESKTVPQYFKLICDLCKKYYLNKKDFDQHCAERNHLKTPMTKFTHLPVNDQVQAFVCSLCRSVSKTLDAMKEHWKRIHSPIMELYTCKTCNVMPTNDPTNYTYEKFERHCRGHHKNDMVTCLVYFVTSRYVCNICKFGFENEKSANEHKAQHQKRIDPAPQDRAINPATIAGIPIQPQTTTLWVADQNVAPDGGRIVQPVVVSYSGLPGQLNRLGIQQPPMLNQQTILPRPPSVVSKQTNTPNKVLKNMLSNRLEQQLQTNTSNQQKASPETILLDSRSNSPQENTNTSVNVNGESSTTNAAAVNQAYMTRVNPDFETMLDTNVSSTSSSPITNTSTSQTIEKEKSKSHSGDSPQPFEVVLVTDEVIENSDEASLTPINTQPIETAQEQINKNESKENSSSAKSFLRVRSVAELEQMKIHLCSICGQSFDKPSIFEQHLKQHEERDQSDRSTPVQMISPMVLSGSNVNTSQLNYAMAKRLKEKMATLLGSSTSEVVKNQMKETANARQPQNLQQQQQQSYWFASCNGTEPTMDSFQAQQNPALASALNSAPLAPQCRLTSASSVNPSKNYQRPLPPSYPSAPAAIVTAARTGAIQLPERNIVGSSASRPSGAATRIPQQSMPALEELPDYQRQSVSSQGNIAASSWNFYNTGNCNQQNLIVMQNNITNAALDARLINANSPQPHIPILQQPQLRTYGPKNKDVGFSNASASFPYQSPSQASNQSQIMQNQQIQRQRPLYMCKDTSCTYTTDNLAAMRDHDKNHLISQQQTQPQVPQQQQQQQTSGTRLPVTQMPTRQRHALPSQVPPRQQQRHFNTLDKRCICRICNLYLSSNQELMDHVATVHNSVPQQVCCYVCDYCPTPLLFENEESLRKHMNITHNHYCEVCKKRYPSKDDLNVHMEVHAINNT